MHNIPHCPTKIYLLGLNICFLQAKVESSASDELRGSLAGHKFPITQDLIEEISTKAKKSTAALWLTCSTYFIPKSI